VGCSHCKVLEHKLKKANIQYEEITDIDIMEQKGFTSAPMLQINDRIYNFVEAINWLTERMA
jgi:glutaredoxin